VIVFSDEIHADLTLPPRHHVPFAMISERAKNNSVTFMAPSKAFNMPGVAASHAIIYNEGLHKRFTTYMESCEFGGGHVFAFPAVEAAYSNGTEWLEQCLAYIQGNIDYLDHYLKTYMPKIKAMLPMASYLVWLDCRELNLSQQQLEDFFVSHAHLALNSGTTFGKEGTGFMRMNVGCPRSVLEQAMKQLKEAYDEL
jgi:cystathionine beta-lyase